MKTSNWNDYSFAHSPVSDLFHWPASRGEWEKYQLTPEQVEFFNENGFLPNVRLLDDDQIEILRKELVELADVYHPAHHLYYEFHSNESQDPNSILFHA